MYSIRTISVVYADVRMRTTALLLMILESLRQKYNVMFTFLSIFTTTWIFFLYIDSTHIFPHTFDIYVFPKLSFKSCYFVCIFFFTYVFT